LRSISAGPGLDSTQSLYIPLKSCQYDDPRVGEFAKDYVHRLDAALLRHLQIHQGNIRAVQPEGFNSLLAVRSLTHQDHVLLNLNDCRNACPQQGMVVYGENPDLVLNGHAGQLFPLTARKIRFQLNH
jgi:hypothetical protein